MAKQLEELSIEEKVQIARAIIALEGAGESLDEIESFYSVDKSVVNKIKKVINERLHEIFEPKQAIAPEKPKATSILERIRKVKVAAPSSESVSKPSKKSGNGNVTQKMKDKVPEILKLIKEFNKTTDKPLKASDSVLRAALVQMGELDKDLKPLVNQSIRDEAVRKELDDLDAEVNKNYPEGYPRKPSITDFLIFLEERRASSPGSIEEEKELEPAGESDSKKSKRG